jgi:dipeptidyl aminopeptidase/acylaminoacyl peptidase
MNADGTNQRPLTTPSSGSDESPAWSPDGTRIAFTRVSGPRATSIVGRERRRHRRAQTLSSGQERRKSGVVPRREQDRLRLKTARTERALGDAVRRHAQATTASCHRAARSSLRPVRPGLEGAPRPVMSVARWRRHEQFERLHQPHFPDPLGWVDVPITSSRSRRRSCCAQGLILSSQGPRLGRAG